MRDSLRFKNNTTIFTLILILTVIYFAAGKLSLSFAFFHQSASPFWLPTGIAITAFIIWGFKIWPAIFIGAFLVNLTTKGTILTCLGIASGNTLEGLFALYLINLLIKDKNIFEKPLNIFKYVISAGIIATFLSALIGVNSLFLTGFVKPENFFSVLTTWWIGDMGGALITAPVILLWITDYKINWKPKKTLEAVLILLLLILSTSLIFMDPSLLIIKLPLIVERYPYPFITFPLILFVAFRFGLRETATVIFIFSVIALIGITNGSERMAAGDPNLAIINLQIFTIIIFWLKMSIASAVENQRKLEKMLRIRVKQNSAVSSLGLSSLSGKAISEIMQQAIQLLCNTLNTEYCKILKLLPDGKELLLIEGIGWKEGYIGSKKIGADLESQAGFTLLSKEPVIVTDFSKEKRFNGSPLLLEHGVVSGMSCIIYGKDKPYGVLGVHTKTKTNFTKQDVDFLQSIANIIALTIERYEYEEEIISSLNEKQILLKEIHHRVKNNLQIISSLLSLQSTHLSENNFRDFFVKSQNRVKSIAIVHEMLYKNDRLSKINFRNYITELSKYISNSYNIEDVKINISAEDIFLDTDITINLGLIINEIISNSVKHAFDKEKEGIISIELKNKNGFYSLNVKDNGKGLPDSFNVDTATTLGMHLVSSLVTQIEGNVEIKNNTGTEYLITFELN